MTISSVDDLKQLLLNEIEAWKEGNAAALAQLPPVLVESAIATAITTAIPAKYLTPALANMKMKYAADAIDSAAKTKKLVQQLSAQLQAQLISFLEKVVVGIIAGNI
jgi:hypothetical protein